MVEIILLGILLIIVVAVAVPSSKKGLSLKSVFQETPSIFQHKLTILTGVALKCAARCAVHRN